MDYAPDGDLDAVDAEEIAIAAGWEGEPEEFIEAAIKAGFIDNGACLSIHDWQEYAGKLIERREKDRQRKAEARRTPVRRTSAGSPPDGARTLPTRPTNPLSPLAVASAPAVSDSDVDEHFACWWDTYGRVGSKADARELYRHWRGQGATAEELLRAAIAYRDHCSSPSGPKIAHARTFLAKKPNRWREWADGEEHGSMDAQGSARLNDVLTAGAQAFGLQGGDHDHDHDHDITGRRAGAALGGAHARRGLPAGRVED
jgi:hypothetical protein